MASPAIASPVGGGGPRKSIGPPLAALPQDAVATSVSFRRWGLGFRQSSFRLIKRALRGDASGVFGRSPASGACCCSLRLSPSGKPDGPETSLRVSPDCVRDSAPRSAAHTFASHGSSKSLTTRTACPCRLENTLSQAGDGFSSLPPIDEIPDGPPLGSVCAALALHLTCPSAGNLHNALKVIHQVHVSGLLAWATSALSAGLWIPLAFRLATFAS